jgi:hypothetical protein
LFLERLANLEPDNARAAEVFGRTFRDLFPTHGVRIVVRPDEPVNPELLFYRASSFLTRGVRPVIQKIWREPSARLKEAGFMLLAGQYMCESGEINAERALRSEYGLDPLSDLSPGLDSFVMVLLHALKNVHLLRYCANPECKEPYFVARRGSQIYCSSPCAEPAQREAKLKWWHERGDARRKESSKARRKHAKAKKA